MKYIIVFFLIFLMCGLCIPLDAISAKTPELLKAEDLLVDRNYAEAFARLQKLSDEGKEEQDYILFLMGNTLLYQKQYEKAIELYKKLVTDSPESVWKQKAIFKQADCYMQLKQFEQAEKIYEQEVIRLVSPERKEQIAKVYLDFAEEYFTGKWVERKRQQGAERIPDYGRAKVFYELALQMEISKEKEEEVRFQVARCAFELGDYGSAINTLLLLQEQYPEGEFLTKVLYYLGRSYLAQGQFIQSRKVFRDFIEDYPDDSNAPEAAFLLSRTYNIPAPYSIEELELGVKALQDFIEIYPDDERVFQAEYEIGLSYYNFSRYDDAIAAFSAYIEKYEISPTSSQADSGLTGNTPPSPSQADSGLMGNTLPNPPQGGITPPNPPQGGITPPYPPQGGITHPTPSQEGNQTGMFVAHDGLPLARYHLGKVYQQQRKFEDAIAVWKEYLQKHPSDKQWSDVQRQIIETEYMIADKLFREKKYEAASKAWEQFLIDHPLDSRNPEIMYRIGETFVKMAEELESSKEDSKSTPDPSQEGDIAPGLYQQAIAQWKRTVSKYPNTDPASRAQYEIGRTLETKLLKFEEAFAAYKQVTWGAYSSEAQNRLREMQAKRLTVLTERVFRTDETPILKITTRNIESLTLKMYKVDLETYFRKMQTTAGVDTLDIALIDPDETWKESIPSTSLRANEGYEKYREFENDVPLKFAEPGAYLVTCSEENVSEEAGYEATTLVLISDLDIILKTTKRDMLVFAQNMRTGETYSDVKFLVSDGKKIFFEGVTGNDGVFHDAIQELKEVQDIRVFAYSNTHYASSTLAAGELRYVVGLESRGYIYTDRPVYRPGQQVNIKGILREVDEQGVLQVPSSPSANPSHQVRGTPSPPPDLPHQGRGIISPPLVGGVGGGGTTFPNSTTLSLDLSQEIATEYTLQVMSSQGVLVYHDTVSLTDFGSFAVDFALSFSAPMGEYRITVSKGKHTYNGTFLVEMYKLEKLKLTIDTDREVYFRGETITGVIKAEYYYGEPVKNKKVSYSLAGIEVFTAMTDKYGEIPFSLDTRNFAESQTLTLTARLDDENVQTGKTVWLATRGFSCEVSTIRNVYLVNEDIEVSVLTKDPMGEPLAKEMSFGVFKRESTPYGEIAEVKVIEQQVATGEDGTGKTLIRIEEGGQYVLRAEGRDRFGNPVSGQIELFISGKDDDIMLRIITDKEEFNVGDSPEVTLFSRASEGLGLLTYEGESILSYQILYVNKEKNPLTLSINSEHAPNFTLAVAQMDGNKFHQAQKEFSVIQGLNISIAPKTPGVSEDSGSLPEYRPGETVTVEITTTDQNGNPVAAEVSLAMVDEALYAQYADMVPPIRDFFYDQRRGLLSKTESSCTFSFSAETREIIEEILEEETRVADEMDKMVVEREETFAESRELLEPGILSELKTEKMQQQVVAGWVGVPAEQPAPPVDRGYGDTERDEAAGEFLAVLREYFPETGYWNPSIVTDHNGKAIVTIQLPDSTTNWRFTSRGITKETLVGEATTEILTKMPFFVEMKTPRMFTEGDKAAILTSIHNYSGEKQVVSTTFTGSMDDTVLERQEQEITSEDGSVLESEYRLDLSQISQFEMLTLLSLEFAVATDPPLAPPKRGVKDRIKRDISVTPWGIEYVATKSGTLQDDRKIEISLPGDRQYLYREMDILLNPSLDRTLLDLASDVPWIFKAPASSPIHEAIVVFNAIKSLSPGNEPGSTTPGSAGVSSASSPGDTDILPAPNAGETPVLPGTDETPVFPGTDETPTLPGTDKMPALSGDPTLRQLQARFISLLTDICLRQNQDGGWNWTGSDQRSDLFVSADAVLLLTEAERLGYTLQPGVLQNGLTYLNQAFQSAQDNETKAYLLYTLAVADNIDFAHINRVYRERNSLHTAGLALLTLIYTEIDRPEITMELLPFLQNRAKRLQDPATGKQMAYWPSDSPYTWLQGDVDTTTLALLALQKADPKSALISGVIEWIYSQRRWIGWGSMRTNARVSSTLLEHFSKTQYATNRYIVDVDVNGTAIQTMTIDSEQGLIVLQIPSGILKDYGNTVSFVFDGRGSLNYVCVLKGISRDVRKTQTHYEVWRYYEPAPLIFQGKEIPRGFSVLDGSYSTWRNTLTQIPLGGFGRVTLQYHRREYEDRQPYRNHQLILEEPIPAGCTVLTQSIQGGFLDYEIGDGKIIFYLNNARYGTVSYDLYGYLPGEYRVLPTKIQSPYHPEQLDYGEPYRITVLGRDQAVTEKYRQTPDELYYYGKALFEAKQYSEAGPLLRELFEQFRLDPEPYKDTAKMLMYIAIAENNSRDIVQYFEILKEKYPDLIISFEDIVRVGKAYRDIGEHERATQVFKATAEASFLKDIQVSGALEGQGEFLASVAYTKDLIFEYPDIPTTETSYYALAQLIYAEAGRAKETRNSKLETRNLTPNALLEQTIKMLHQFLILYPENPIVDEVSFSLANAYIDLEDFESVTQLTKRFQQRYPKSTYLSGYQYIEGYVNFELEHYEDALNLCKTVATRKYPDKQGRMIESAHKNLAIYIMGQIYHSMGQPEKAIAEYEKVKDLFPDAKESIEHFTRKRLKLDEVTTFKPGEEIQVKLHYRNVKDVMLLMYRVDLMKLYLLQKNLNNITNVNLAGITPYYQETLVLGEGKDYADKEYSMSLPLKKEGAYLVVAKESELDASGMILLSMLKMEVDEDVVSGRVRINVMNAETGRYENRVHVKVIGSGDTKFVSGETDLRGIFIADNIHGSATVIARKNDQYAFYRGKTTLQPPETTAVQRPLRKTPADMRSQVTEQLGADNYAIQLQSEEFLRGNLYQNKQMGVEVQAAY
jgi:TolA-binding protein